MLTTGGVRRRQQPAIGDHMTAREAVTGTLCITCRESDGQISGVTWCGGDRANELLPVPPGAGRPGSIASRVRAGPGGPWACLPGPLRGGGVQPGLAGHLGTLPRPGIHRPLFEGTPDS
jgi:hypothetical protein